MENWYAVAQNEWIFNNNIRNELSLLLYISSLTASTWICFATNQHFAEKFDISEVSISKKIKKLEKEWLIEIEYEKEWNVVKKRNIRLKKSLTDRLRKVKPPVKEKFKDNSINNKNININIYIDEIYNSYYWRIPKDKKKYTKSSQAKLYIKALLKEYSKEDLLKSIDNYFRVTDSKYIMAVQYFFSNSTSSQAKNYRAFTDYLDLEVKEIKDVDINNALNF